MSFRGILTRSRHEILVLLLVLLGLLFVPIPLGSNRPYAWYIFEIYTYSIFVFWIIGAVFYYKKIRLRSPLPGILCLLLAWLGYVYLQGVELPDTIVRTLNPFVYDYQKFLETINVDARNTLSLDAGASFNELLKYGSYVAVFFLVLVTVTTRARLMCTMGLIVTAGLAEAIFGIYSNINDVIIFSEIDESTKLRAGTFVNRNHFSNYLTMSLALVLGILTSIVNARTDERGKRLGRLQDKDIGALFGLLAIALVMLAAIFTSGSRAPIVFFTLGFVMMLGLAYFTKQTTDGEFFLAPIAVLGVTVVIVLIGYDYSVMRLVEKDLFAGERMLQNVLGLQLFSDVWLTGVGAGTYRWAFTMFRNENLRFVTYDHAHNDYLEFAIEEGVIGLIILSVAMGLILAELYRGYRARRNPWMRGVIFGCLMSTIYTMLHSLVEFNLQIPANAVYFFAIAALGLTACHIDRQRWHGRQRHHKHIRRDDTNR